MGMKQDPGISFSLGSVPYGQNIYFKRIKRNVLRFVTYIRIVVPTVTNRELCDVTYGEWKVALAIRACRT
jgi:hypothetical protein